MSSGKNNSASLVFEGIPPVLGELIRALPDTMELDHPDAGERLFPGPGDADEGALEADWKAFVEPDLQQGFIDARETVRSDLRAMQDSGAGATLRIPHQHCDAWLNVLTQARLAIAAVHNLGEKELSAMELPPINNARDAALHRMHLYGLLAESILQILDESGRIPGDDL